MTDVLHGSGTPAPPAHKDYGAAKIGMWLFLFTEILLFGGLFILYAWNRTKYPNEFHEGGQHLNFVIGTVNTVVLLTSSLAMAVSITAVRKDDRKLAVRTLTAVIALGCLFLVNKAFEWGAEFGHGIYPNSSILAALPVGEQLFFGLYFTMTGIHGLHVVAGITVLSVMLVLLRKGKIGSGDFVKLENAGLYWHLVDVIWIYLLPLFYLAA